MTRRKNSAKQLNLKEIFAEQEDYLRRLIQQLDEEYPYVILDARYEKVREEGVIRSQVPAQRFCRAFEEVRQYFRPRRKQNEPVSFADGRRQGLLRALALESLFLAA